MRVTAQKFAPLSDVCLKTTIKAYSCESCKLLKQALHALRYRVARRLNATDRSKNPPFVVALRWLKVERTSPK